MERIYVTDTNSIIRYFRHIFKVPEKLSSRANEIIKNALIPYPSDIKLSIPSVVFIEIFDKWYRNEEMAKQIQYEVFEFVIRSQNVELKPIDDEVMTNILRIGGRLSRHDINDKIIVASAMMLNCPLITTDQEIINFIRTSGTIPSFIN